jgi:stage V sporulation protein G
MTAAITVTSIKRLDGNGPTKAFADVAIGGITVHGVRVIDAGKGPFIAMPSSKGKDGKWHDHVTLSKPLAEKVRAIVLSAWRGDGQESDPGAGGTGGRDRALSPSDSLQGAAFGQSRIDQLARRFDERGPDDEIPRQKRSEAFRLLQRRASERLPSFPSPLDRHPTDALGPSPELTLATGRRSSSRTGGSRHTIGIGHCASAKPMACRQAGVSAVK